MPAITPGIQTKPSDLFLPKSWFDDDKCARDIDALKLYRAQYDDKLQALRPVHDWSSHAADLFRYLALSAICAWPNPKARQLSPFGAALSKGRPRIRPMGQPRVGKLP